MVEIVLQKIDNSPEENAELESEPEVAEEARGLEGGGVQGLEPAGDVVEPAVDTTEPPVVKRPRGRPPKAKAEPKAKPAKPKPKAQPPKAKPPPPDSSSDSSSDVEETLQRVYKHHVARPDMETAILQMLVNRRASEQEKRRNLWGQLARF